MSELVAALRRGALGYGHNLNTLQEAADELERQAVEIAALIKEVEELQAEEKHLDGYIANWKETARRLAAQVEGLNGRFEKDQERIKCQAEQLEKLHEQLATSHP